MKKLLCISLVLAMVLSLCTGCGTAPKAAETAVDNAPVQTAEVSNESSAEPGTQVVADSIICGKIYTADDTAGTVEAIAVKDGKIIYAGDKDGVLALQGDNTDVTELNDGELVIPGFVDGHTHVTQMQVLNMMVVFSTDDNQQQYIEKFTKFIEENPDMPIYMGKGWINSSFDNGCPTADILDKICPEKPVAMLSSDNHSLWCNTAFMKMMGVTDDIQDPEGGKVERNADGTPNGCFRETAMTMVAGPVLAILALSPEINTANIISAQQQYASLGYTSYLEAMVNSQDDPWITTQLEMYESLDKDDLLLLYTQGAFVINNSDDALELVDKAIEYKNSTAGGKFEVTHIKIFMDGVIEGSTAYLIDPYANRDTEYHGESRWTSEADLDKLTQIIEKANAAGLAVQFHSMGDQASKDALDCIERAYNEIGTPVLDARNSLTHLQVITAEDIARMKELNVTAVLNDWACKQPGFYQETEVKYLGEERAANEYLYKSFLDAGVHSSFATDFGGSFLVDSIYALHVFVTRTTRDDDPAHVLNPAECLTMDEALKLMTSGGAYQLRCENTFGTLTEGMDADLMVLNQDLLTIANDQIMKTKILKTMSDGQWIYDRDSAE